MKKLLLIVSLMFAICANAQVDTLSYIVGYASTLNILADDSTFAQTEDGIKEIYRGIEDNFPKPEMGNDSIYIVNYAIGSMQGVFFTDGLEHISEDKFPPVSCIVAGLQKVADNQIDLPQDTIDAKKIIVSCPDSIKPVNLPSEERCMFFTAYGVLKGFPIGLDQLMEEYGIENIEPNYQYYAKGFADVLWIYMNTSPQNAYDFGKMIAWELCNAISVDFPGDKTWDVMSPDFLLGVRAALQLEELKLSDEEMDRIIDSD